jgi:enoyl reductase-like protein
LSYDFAEVSVGFPELVNATFGVDDGRLKGHFDSPNGCLAMQSPVGVSLLAIAVYQSAQWRLTDRYREQAHSYKGSVVLQRLTTTKSDN